MSDRKPPIAGKGDKPRTINNQNWRNRFDEIKGFGFKPKWERQETKIEGFRGKPKRKNNVTFPVPKNEFGIFAHHTDDGKPLDDKALQAIIDGSITAMEPKYQEELKKKIVLDDSGNEVIDWVEPTPTEQELKDFKIVGQPPE